MQSLGVRFGAHVNAPHRLRRNGVRAADPDRQLRGDRPLDHVKRVLFPVGARRTQELVDGVGACASSPGPPSVSRSWREVVRQNQQCAVRVPLADTAIAATGHPPIPVRFGRGPCRHAPRFRQWCGPSVTAVRPRQPTERALYQVVRDHLETFLVQAAALRDGGRAPVCRAGVP
jgi:hypothetical protein